MNILKLYSAFLSIVLMSVCVAGANPMQIDEQTVSSIDSCVQAEYNMFILDSRSLCVGKSRYFDSGGNTNSHSETYLYSLNFPDWAGYIFRNNTETVNIEGGLCEFTIHARVTDPQNFSCYYWTKGCGLSKGGGHVRGSCNVGIEYIPRDGDIAKFKRYCISRFGGGPMLPEPRSFPVGCQLN